MPGGLYPNYLTFERTVPSSLAASSAIGGAWVAPCDLEVIGLAAVATAAAAGTPLLLNVQNTPTSQTIPYAPAGGTTVAQYFLWTVPNQPQIPVGQAICPGLPTTYPTVVTPQAYQLNYPFPGPAGTVGFVSAQSQTTTTSNPTLAPPVSYKYGPLAMTAPDNSYLDYNLVSSPASIVHAGDQLLAKTGTTIGGIAGVTVVVFLAKR